MANCKVWLELSSVAARNKPASVGKPAGACPKPILDNGFGVRWQIDLIDMRKTPDKWYHAAYPYKREAPDTHYCRWICHIVDHTSGMTMALEPLRNKTVVEVTRVLIKAAAAYGPPAILHSDNGKEFSKMEDLVDGTDCMGNLVQGIKDAFVGTVCVRGAARKPTTQGLVERHNKTIEDQITRYMTTHDTTRWAHALPALRLAKNQNVCEVRKVAPITVATGRVPLQSILASCAEKGFSEEDELLAHLRATGRFVHCVKSFEFNESGV